MEVMRIVVKINELNAASGYQLFVQAEAASVEPRVEVVYEMIVRRMRVIFCKNDKERECRDQGTEGLEIDGPRKQGSREQRTGNREQGAGGQKISTM